MYEKRLLNNRIVRIEKEEKKKPVKTVKPKKKNLIKKKRNPKKKKFVQSDNFLESYQWRKVRYDALKKNNGCCELCGRSKMDGIVLNVDHINPRKTHPKLALNVDNLQVLCHDCNHGKGNLDDTDWRGESFIRDYKLKQGGYKNERF